MIRGERGQPAVFLLPALLFTIAMVIFPTFFGLYIAFTDWNLELARRAVTSTAWTICARCSPIPISGTRSSTWSITSWPCWCNTRSPSRLALLLNAEIRGRKFFRVVFLMPFMLSPVAVSWMIGKSILEYRFGPVATLRARAGLGYPRLLRLALDRADEHHGHGCLGLHPLHHDPAARRPAGPARRGAGGGQGRWRHRLAKLLEDHLPADAAGEPDGGGAPDHLRAEARGHRDQCDRGRTRRGHRHGVELHLSGVSRPIQCRLRHHAGRVLSGDHHHLREPAAHAWPAAGCGGSHEGSAPVAGHAAAPDDTKAIRRAGRDMSRAGC